MFKEKVLKNNVKNFGILPPLTLPSPPNLGPVLWAWNNFMHFLALNT